MTTTTSITELKQSNKIAEVPTEIGFNTAHSFELIQRVGNMFAKSDLVPTQYKNNVSNCVIALSMAARIGVDPLMAMQNLHIIHGSPSWSSKFLIATFNACGRFSSLRYEFTGTEGQDDWGCRAYAIELSTGETIKGAKVTLGMAKTEGWTNRTGSKWKAMPELMLSYRAAAFFIRAYAPELSLGLQTLEEVQDTGKNEYNATLDDLRHEDIIDIDSAQTEVIAHG